MQEQFVTYEIALKLKELGFDEECLGFWWTYSDKYEPEFYISKTEKQKEKGLLAPLWQQAIDWFRKTRKTHIEISHHENGWGSYLSMEMVGDRFAKGYYAKIPYFLINTIEVGCSFRSYEVAREQAVLKALELCK